MNTKGAMFHMPIVQRTEELSTSPPDRRCQNACLIRMSAGVLCLGSNSYWSSRRLKVYVAKDEEDRTGFNCDLLY